MKTTFNNRRIRERAKARAECTEANKQIDIRIRANWGKYVEDLLMIAEKATRGGNIKQLYDTTKKSAGK